MVCLIVIQFSSPFAAMMLSGAFIALMVNTRVAKGQADQIDCQGSPFGAQTESNFTGVDLGDEYYIYQKPPRVEVSVKEMILIASALLLLVTSLCLFYKNWKKNYRDINQLPYYSYLYKDDPPPPVVPLVGTGVGPNPAVVNWAKAAAAVALVNQSKRLAAKAQNRSQDVQSSRTDGAFNGANVYRPFTSTSRQSPQLVSMGDHRIRLYHGRYGVELIPGNISQSECGSPFVYTYRNVPKRTKSYDTHRSLMTLPEFKSSTEDNKEDLIFIKDPLEIKNTIGKDDSVANSVTATFLRNNMDQMNGSKTKDNACDKSTMIPNDSSTLV